MAGQRDIAALGPSDFHAEPIAEVNVTRSLSLSSGLEVNLAGRTGGPGVVPGDGERIAAKAARARGAGTGLSGGCLPSEGGLVISLMRMNRVLEVDYENQVAVVEPGLVNLHLSWAVGPQGFYYAPDPSSQQACTIGGNIANNSGGPHTLKYGVTTNHVLGLEVVLPDGELLWLGGKTRDAQGYDLVGLFVGSEGTFGIATKIVVRILKKPQAVKTVLAVFDQVDQASEAVSAIIALIHDVEVDNGLAEFSTLVVGIVTFEDVLEQIFGEIEDEQDLARHIPPVEAAVLDLDGTTNIRDLETQYGVVLPGGAGFETLAGFLLSRLGYIPNPGDRIEEAGRRYTVLEMERNRIARVLIEKISEKQPD